MSGVKIESGAQLLARLSAKLRPSLTKLDIDIFPDNGPYPKKLIEITGESNSGKSVLLMEIMAKAILPVRCGGKGSDVIFFDLDNKFPTLFFTKILEKIMNISGGTSDEVEIIQAVDNSLKHLHVYNCYSPEEFQFAFFAVDELLFTDKSIYLIAVDSICAFYWLDCKEKAVKMENHYRKIVGKLKDICNEYSIIGVYTRPTYYANKWSGNNLADYIFELIPYSEGVKGIEFKMNINGRKFNKFITVDMFGMKILG